MKNQDLPLILGSQSPRRKRLLAEAGIRFQVFTPKIQEKAHPPYASTRRGAAIVKEISRRKALDLIPHLPRKWQYRCLLLTADTLVFHKGKVLGKPSSEAQAIRMLRELSGNTHSVYTGITLAEIRAGKTIKIQSKAISTRVKFFALTDKNLKWYLSTKEPMDKAGAYGAQDFGSFLVEKYWGSYTNVVGLPVGHTLRMIESFTGKSFHTWQLK